SPGRVLVLPAVLEAADGRRRESRRILAEQGGQRLREVAGRDTLQIQDRQQRLDGLRAAHVGGRIAGAKRMRAGSSPPALRSRTRGCLTATGPIPVITSRSGRWPWRTTRWRPSSVLRSAWLARNSATSASIACASKLRAPPRKISVSRSSNAPG